jgi:isoleucyl-tRNA synthetase
MDWENSYYTMSDKNIEYIWYFLKKCQQKGWLYKGTSVLPWCIRCGTSLSQHELLDSYKELTHPAVYIKCPIEGRKKEFLLIWTTTIWTLTSNVAAAVHPALIYCQAEKDGEIYYLLKNRLSFINKNLKILKELKGKAILGLEYQSPYQNLPIQKEVRHKVVPWKEVSEKEGSGIVHIAPGCGPQDYGLFQELKMPKSYLIAPLDEFGNYKKGFGWLSGKNVKEVTQPLISDLKERGFLFKLEDYLHRYPVCWRCREELVFRLVSEWFLKADPIRPLMKKEAEVVKWSPAFAAKLMQDWLDNMQDWCISRKRYWGLPLPFYECECRNLVIVESKKELEKFAENKKKIKKLPELHRPWIDQIKIRCPKCGKIVQRVKEVGDCWLDAGIVPFSTLKYLEDKKYWQRWFPADFICEMREQIRLWFYSLLFMSVTLEGVTPYKNVLVYEKVNDEKGRPMHKSLGNVIWFDEAVNKMGADVMRWIYLTQNPAFNLNFGFKFGKEATRKLMFFWNSYLFFETYREKKEKIKFSEQSSYLLDNWIISRINELIQTVTQNLDKYEVTLAVRAIENFVIKDLSQWYIRRSRKRFQRPESKKELKEASQTLAFVLLTLSKLTAPFIPFLSEKIYQGLIRQIKQQGLKSQIKPSVHLTNWPKVKKRLINKKLNQKMEKVRLIVTQALAERAKAGIKVRQPLARLKIKDPVLASGAGRGLRFKLEEELLNLIKEEVNVKEIIFDTKIKKELELDTKITPELKEEGIIREVIRQIQQMRKLAGFRPKDEILVRYFGDSALNEILKRKEKIILREGKIKDFQLRKDKEQTFDFEKAIKVNKVNLWLAIKKTR